MRAKSNKLSTLSSQYWIVCPVNVSYIMSKIHSAVLISESFCMIIWTFLYEAPETWIPSAKWWNTFNVVYIRHFICMHIHIYAWKWIQIYYRESVRIIWIDYPEPVNTDDSCQIDRVGFQMGDPINESQWKGVCGRIIINDPALINGTKGQYDIKWYKSQSSFQTTGTKYFKNVCFFIDIHLAPTVCYSWYENQMSIYINEWKSWTNYHIYQNKLIHKGIKGGSYVSFHLTPCLTNVLMYVWQIHAPDTMIDKGKRCQCVGWREHRWNQASTTAKNNCPTFV